jgi:hypothetical protein
VGRYIVNMTRGKDPSMQSSVNPNENVPSAILTLTKNVLGQNVTKSIEPMIKRIGVVETRGEPSLSTTVVPTLALVNVDAKKKKKKQKKKKDPTVIGTSTTRLPDPPKQQVIQLSQSSSPGKPIIFQFNEIVLQRIFPHSQSY